MKALTNANLFKAAALTASAVLLGSLWWSATAEATDVQATADKACSYSIVLDKEMDDLDMKLMVHRPFGAPVIILTDI